MVPAGGCWPSHRYASSALTGTSKNTTSETTAGETLFNEKLNKRSLSNEEFNTVFI